MTSTITPQSKNTATLANEAKDAAPSSMTWDEATDTWDSIQGTWDSPERVYNRQVKNTATLANQAKN